jgi:hypothetical protein
MGFLLAFGFGLGLFLTARLKSMTVTIAFSALMWAGMIAAHARAPWIAAVVIFFVYLMLGPNGLARFSKAFFASAILAALVLASPIGGRIIDNLPFVGKVGAENVEYRQELAKQSWEQIKQNPIAGNPFVLKNLESLRQGEGIIDLLNAYTNIAMYYGLPALFLYLGPYLLCLWYALRTSRKWAPIDPEMTAMGAITVACVFGFLWAMGAGGFGPYPTNFSIVVIGLSVVYARLEQPKVTAQSRPAPIRGMRLRAGR